ncbi:nucleotidyltransferase family protein [Lentzea terrae]|uniref:hypothetical protein n=1 Tax=Lentzea terrae TaxID=2200761 RepID=UPI0018E4E517|nr:hypothetical protein [Lentzea terrae]
MRSDSDVDVAVQCTDVTYWEEAKPGTHPTTTSPYAGIWTPAKLRSELGIALRKKFPGQVDSTGSTAFRVNSGSARVDADVVPCFDYKYYLSRENYRPGSKVFKKDGRSIVNYPAQQLTEGRTKNGNTSSFYKQAVRILKRTENAMVLANSHREVPSFFVECLTYNCPDSLFMGNTWSDTIRSLLLHMWETLQGNDEPTVSANRWVEVSRCKYLFHKDQAWSRADGRDFAKAAWNYLGYS